MGEWKDGGDVLDVNGLVLDVAICKGVAGFCTELIFDWLLFEVLRSVFGFLSLDLGGLLGDGSVNGISFICALESLTGLL